MCRPFNVDDVKDHITNYAEDKINLSSQLSLESGQVAELESLSKGFTGPQSVLSDSRSWIGQNFL